MADQPTYCARFQFRLRTLMIVVTLLAVPLGYVGWKAKIVRDRKAALDWIKERRGIVRIYEDELPSAFRPVPEWYLKQKAKYPSGLAWFGDQPIYSIDLREAQATLADRDRIAAMFPEAHVMPEESPVVPKKGTEN